MRIGYVSFRIAGTDGVSLEAERWRTMLERMGHRVTFVAGELDQKGLLIPQLHFTDPYVYGLHEKVITNGSNYQQVERDIFAVAGQIEGELRQAFRKNSFDKLIISNVFSLPIHFPLAVALERVINEFQIPTVSRNHDFWWERQRYLKSDCFEFFKRFFPPNSPYLKHVTINKIAHDEMLKRTKMDSMIIGDSFDFESKDNIMDDYSAQWRKDFGIAQDDIVFLQATRIVPRKRIEWAIELVKKLNNPKIVLVLAGYSGDESGNYLDYLKSLVTEANIRALYIGSRVTTRREVKDHLRFYTLWDCFVNCDLSTYPSDFEGFGNQFIEAIYFKKPVFVNRYEVYKTDLEPLGFETVSIDGEVTDKAVAEVQELLNNPEKVKHQVEKNFEIGKANFSYQATTKKLEELGF